VATVAWWRRWRGGDGGVAAWISTQHLDPSPELKATNARLAMILLPLRLLCMACDSFGVAVVDHPSKVCGG
jgi:hypothetical protein